MSYQKDFLGFDILYRVITVACAMLLVTMSATAQEPDAGPGNVPATPPAKAVPQDPATPSDVMTETLKTIREVENLNKYIEMNKTLQNENQSLKQQLASLTDQVNKLAQEIKTQNEVLKKQLLTLPEFKIKSKVVGMGGAMAILDVGGKSIRIREKVEMSIPVENGVWTLIQVEKITKDVVEIKFLELDRTVTLYD